MTDREELDRLRSEVERLGRELVETGAALAECNAERERLKEEFYLAKCFLRGCCEALGA